MHLRLFTLSLPWIYVLFLFTSILAEYSIYLKHLESKTSKLCRVYANGRLTRERFGGRDMHFLDPDL